MSDSVCLDYFYGDEVKIDSFYRLPRFFITDETYKNVSLEIKCLYSLMLDRVTLSMRNGWREEDGRVFIYFTLNDTIRLLNVGKNKAVSIFQQMETLGLIRRRKQGQGKPARVFVRTFVENEPENEEKSPPDCAETPALSAITPEAENIQETPPVEAAPMPDLASTLKMVSTPVHDVKRPATQVEGQSTTRQETPDAVQRGVAGLLNDCAVGVRRLGDILAQRFANGAGIPVGVNSGTLSAPPVRTESDKKAVCESYVRDFAFEGDRWRNVSLIRKEIKEHMDFSMLKRDNLEMMEQLCGYMDIMVQTCCEQTPTVRINGSEYSRAMVRKRLYQLDATHLEYVWERMKECAPKVRNIRAYILTALFNSYDTIDLYYETKASYDKSKACKELADRYDDDL